MMGKRKTYTGLQRAKFFEAKGGICHICGQKIKTGEAWDIEHIIPLEISEDDSEENKAPAHRKCHKAKTRKDSKDIAKCKRVNAKHIGAWKPKSSLSKGRFKKKFDGTVIDRETGQPVGRQAR